MAALATCLVVRRLQYIVVVTLRKKDVPGTDEKELRRVAKPLVFSFPLAGGRLPVPLFPPPPVPAARRDD